MLTKIVICELCGVTTRVNECIPGSPNPNIPFIFGYDSEEKQLTDKPETADKHICQECIRAIDTAVVTKVNNHET